jgi:putative beta-lysine N-acetyltransferase
VADYIIKIGRSLVQHGPYNRRIYLMKLDARDMPHILPALDRLAQDNQYEKILTKIPSASKADFKKQGYVQEAVIPEYFGTQEHAVFMCKYLSSGRKKITDYPHIQDILSLAKQHKHPSKKDLPPSMNIRICHLEDAHEMSQIYKSVFKTYPFPIFDAEYLTTVMKNKQACYFCIEKDRQINAIAASEIDSDHKGVEMTDFATLPEYRGQGLAGFLLDNMERIMAGQGLKTAFSIARALSPAMNILFASKGYAFGGTLANNTQISGRIESMNVWYKRLGPSRN